MNRNWYETTWINASITQHSGEIRQFITQSNCNPKQCGHKFVSLDFIWKLNFLNYFKIVSNLAILLVNRLVFFRRWHDSGLFNFRKLTFVISLIHTFVNIPALIRKRSVFLSSRAGIFTKVWIGDIEYHLHDNKLADFLY